MQLGRLMYDVTRFSITSLSSPEAIMPEDKLATIHPRGNFQRLSPTR